jgi:hypothetical protein
MNRVRSVLLVALFSACSGGESPADSPPDPRDAILNGQSEASSGTYWYSGTGWQFRLAIYGDGTCVEQGGLVGNGTRRVFTWTKVAPDLIVIDTSSAPTGVCYIVTLRAIQGSFASGSFSAQADEAAGCNTGFTREFTLTGGDVPY